MNKNRSLTAGTAVFSLCCSRQRKDGRTGRKDHFHDQRGDHPLNIDQLLVMTFTNAAAAEMRERIGAAVEKAAGASPR